MALGLCIPDLIEQGKISGTTAKKAQRMYDALVARHQHGMPRAEAEARATAETVTALENAAAERRRQMLLMADAQLRIIRDSRTVFAGGRFRDGPINGLALSAQLAAHPDARGIANVEGRWSNIQQDALGRMFALLDRHAPGITGTIRDKSGVEDIVREAHAEASGNAAAREIADAWRDVAEYLRQRFNQAGGHIAKLDGWALPQAHDGVRIGAVSVDRWIADIVPMLDRSAMIDRATGLPMDDDVLTGMLRQTYEASVSDGWSRRTAGEAGGAALGDTRAQQRVLHFRDAAAWLDYQSRYGVGTGYEAMVRHIERMSRDIAMMEILGPDPAATVRWMRDLLQQEAMTRGDDAARNAAKKWDSRINNLWRELTGEAHVPENKRLAQAMTGVRNLQVAQRLGSAVISAVSDHATAALTARYNGLPIIRAADAYLRQLNPLDPADRAFAMRQGIVAAEYIGRVGADMRNHMDANFGGRLAGRTGIDGRLEQFAGVTRRLADGVLQASGLAIHTQARRAATFMDFSGAVRHYAERSFADLPDGFRDFLERYGMAAADWQVLRDTQPMMYRGLEWLDQARLPDGLRDRWREAVLRETEYAVPTGDLRLRAAISGNLRPGTVVGETGRTMFQFKMFPVQVVMLHGGRALRQSNLTGKAGYATAFLASTTIMGALALQLSLIKDGKSPRAMADPDFWWRAALKGGGLGVYGDALELSRNEYGKTALDLFRGPTFTTVDTLATAANAAVSTAVADPMDRNAQDRAGTLRRRAATGLAREVPGSSLWFIRAAYERLLIDTVAGWADPNYADAVRDMERRAVRQNSPYFAPPSAEGFAPVTAPDLGNAFTVPQDE